MKHRSSRRFLLLAVASVCIAGPQGVLAQSKPPVATLAAEPRGVYARIDMRSAQDMIRRLSVAYGSDRRAAIREVTREASAFMPPVLYALANALAEDHAEEAIFWYHVGRMRAVYDSLRCKDASARGGVTVLGQGLNMDLRASMFYRRDRLVAIAQKAIDWDLKNPPRYDHRWIALYGTVAASSAGTDPDEVTVPESEWPAILKRVHGTHLKSVQDFVNEKKGN
jgi:hypothetical protein